MMEKFLETDRIYSELRETKILIIENLKLFDGKPKQTYSNVQKPNKVDYFADSQYDLKIYQRFPISNSNEI